MPFRSYPNILPFLNIVAVAFTLVAEIIKAYVRSKAHDGVSHEE